MSEIKGECKQVFKRIDEKLDGILDWLQRVDNKYDKHVDESVEYREKVNKHEHILSDIAKGTKIKRDTSQWRIALITGTIVGLISAAATLIARFV